MQSSCMGTSAPLCCWTGWFDGRNTKFQGCEHIVQHDMLIRVKSRLGTKMTTTHRGAGPRERMRYQTDQIGKPTDALHAQEPHLRSFSAPRGHVYIFGALVHIINEFAFKIGAACSSASWHQKHKKRVMQSSYMGTSAPLCCSAARQKCSELCFQEETYSASMHKRCRVKLQCRAEIARAGVGSGRSCQSRSRTHRNTPYRQGLRGERAHQRYSRAPQGAIAVAMAVTWPCMSRSIWMQIQSVSRR